MDKAVMMQRVQEALPEKRWRHTLGVMQSAVQLAERYGEDPDKAELAALLHDVAKYWKVDDLAATIRSAGLPAELLDCEKELWHAPVGAWVAEQEYGVMDSDVLNAIRYHTSGRPGMSTLEKIVCLADYIEPGRDFPDVDQIRKKSKKSLEEALVAGLDSTLAFLIKKNKRIFPLTVEARNGLLQEWKKQEDELNG